VHLLTLALRGCADPAAALRAFPGSHRFLLEYVSEEVLARQPAEARSFLLRASLLERL
jgi:LuxR family maltose regulon positive regulatory protein